jgi:hypothetical protein
LYKPAKFALASVLAIIFNSAGANCDSYPYKSNQLIYTNIANEKNIVVTCSFEIDPQGFSTDPAIFAVLFAKSEMSRFLMGYELIKDQFRTDITKLKVGCSGLKSNQSLAITLEKVIKIDSCSDNNKVLVTIKKIL